MLNDDSRWIDLVGAVNVRDLGGLPAGDGTSTRFSRLVRADNLQDLTDADVSHLVGAVGLRDVVDLRSRAEIVREGPGPLTRVPEVTVHHFSLLAEAENQTGVDGEAVLPWAQDDEPAQTWLPPGEYYFSTLKQRPASVLGALRVVASSEGAALVHCAAGKDRTGVLVALALTIADVPRESIVDDYALSNTRIERIVARLKKTPTYADDLEARPLSSHFALPEAMEHFLDLVDEHFGGPLSWLVSHGWTPADSEALRARLVG